MSQPAGGTAKGSGACSLETVEKQAQGCALVVFLNVLEVVSGIHFQQILVSLFIFIAFYLTVVGKPKGSKKVINHWEK